MPSLDLKTIGIIGLMLHTALGFVLLLIYLTRKTYPGFKSWTASQACWVLASAAFFSRGWMGESLSVLLSNPLFILCSLFIRNGMARFYGYDGEVRWRRASLVVAVASVLFCYWFKFGVDNVNLRIAGHSLGLSILLLDAALEPMVRKRNRSPIQAMVSASLVLAVACMVVRAWLALVNPLYFDLFLQDVMLKPMLLMSFFGMVILVYGFIALTHERMERELLDTQARLQELADTDSLTGLVNRRKFTELVAHDIGLARRHGHVLSLILFDLDHFKLINDAHGHAAGDAVLAEVARTCLETVRQTDIVARWGGEEFAVLMPETDLEGARRMAVRLRELLRDLRPLEGQEVRTTASFGVAQLNAGGRGESFEKLAARADACLYRAKRDGRDRVCVSA